MLLPRQAALKYGRDSWGKSYRPEPRLSLGCLSPATSAMSSRRRQWLQPQQCHDHQQGLPTKTTAAGGAPWRITSHRISITEARSERCFRGRLVRRRRARMPEERQGIWPTQTVHWLHPFRPHQLRPDKARHIQRHRNNKNPNSVRSNGEVSDPAIHPSTSAESLALPARRRHYYAVKAGIKTY